jgi:predicted DNA-binding protein (MmcQ/YjbR family)
MDAEAARAFLSSLPHVIETASNTTRWGDKLVFRVGEKKVGGKMFAQIDFEKDGRAVLSLATTPERFRELVERDGIIPAPYRARMHWIALMRWNAIRETELKELLLGAVALSFAKLTKKTRALLTRSGEQR